MPRPNSYAVLCLKKKMRRGSHRSGSLNCPLVKKVERIFVRPTAIVFLTFDAAHPGLLSFPTRRSSDLTRRQVAIQNRVASNIGISQSTFSVKVLNLFSRSRRKTNKRKSKHSAMLRNKETRHRMFIGLLNTTRKLA